MRTSRWPLLGNRSSRAGGKLLRQLIAALLPVELVLGRIDRLGLLENLPSDPRSGAVLTIPQNATLAPWRRAATVAAVATAITLAEGPAPDGDRWRSPPRPPLSTRASPPPVR